jgi:transposase InsO family protein
MYTFFLHVSGVRISMTGHNDPKENAIVEYVNGILKLENLNYQSFESIEWADRAANKAVDFYNNRRLHRSLNLLMPREAATCSGVISKQWISHKDKYGIDHGLRINA